MSCFAGLNNTDSRCWGVYWIRVSMDTAIRILKDSGPNRDPMHDTSHYKYA